MRGKLRAYPSFADVTNTSLCPPGFYLWPQSPFTPYSLYSQAPQGPLDLMGATVQPHLMQGGRLLSGHGVGIRCWYLIQKTGTLLHQPKTLWAQQVLQSAGGHSDYSQQVPILLQAGMDVLWASLLHWHHWPPGCPFPLGPPGHVHPLPMTILVPRASLFHGHPLHYGCVLPTDIS